MNQMNSGLLVDPKPINQIKLDFLPIGSPEINFVLGPPAMDLQPKMLSSKANKVVESSQSIFDKHTRVAQNEKIAIKHIQNGGPTIYVTNKRVKRILKRRKKRVAFLIQNPEFSLPYKFRSKGPKHQSRSKSAKGRRRKGDGRFAKTGQMPVDFTVSIDDQGEIPGEDEENLIIRNKL